MASSSRLELGEPRSLLLHYMEAAGVTIDIDVAYEIEDIVSGIVEEAVEEATRRMRLETDFLVAMISERLGDPNFEEVFRQDVGRV